MKALPAVGKLAEAFAEWPSVVQRVAEAAPDHLRVDIAGRRLNCFKNNWINGAGFVEYHQNPAAGIVQSRKRLGFKWVPRQ